MTKKMKVTIFVEPGRIALDEKPSPTYDHSIPVDAAFEARMARHYIPDATYGVAI